MLFWIGLAILTAAVLAALLRPLAGAPDRASAPAEADLSVYRDQLKEIESDRNRGLIEPGEAEAARTEVARRLLARAGRATADERDGAKTAGTAPIRTAIAAVIPLFSIALYLIVGAPGTPGKPYAPPGSKPVEQSSAEELVAMVEARLRDVPDDGKGWDVIAPVYYSLGRYADAETAYANALRLVGETPKRLKGVAESSIVANNGLVTEGARRAFSRILELEPGNGEAQFGLALALEQDGKLSEAAESYRKLLETVPADAPWRPSIEVRLAKLLRGGGRPDPNAPSPESSKEEQDKFILGMVERLAARLKDNGNDLPGWLQLVRSYKVLGRDADAIAALAAARKTFEADQKAMSELNELAASLGLKS